MSHRPFITSSRCLRLALALLLSAIATAGSPLAAISSAATGGAQRPVSATFGDCKNDNGGLHLGYLCQAPPSVIGGVVTF